MTVQTSRKIAAPPSSVFAAFENSDRLAVWWGPAGFANIFDICEFKPGGKWSFVMHGPDGKNCRRMERILVPANEQLLERLSAEVLGKQGGG